MKPESELPKSMELRQNKYLNNRVEQEWGFTSEIQRTRTLRGVEALSHAVVLDKSWESIHEMFWLVQNTRVQRIGVAAFW